MATPTGTVTLYYNSNVTVATFNLDSNGNFSGSGTVTLPDGQYPFTVAYSGDSNNPPATSAPQTVTVTNTDSVSFTMPSTIQSGTAFSVTGTVTPA